MSRVGIKRDGSTNELTETLSGLYGIKPTAMRARLGQIAKQVGLNGVGELTVFLGAPVRKKTSTVVSSLERRLTPKQTRFVRDLRNEGATFVLRDRGPFTTPLIDNIVRRT